VWSLFGVCYLNSSNGFFLFRLNELSLRKMGIKFVSDGNATHMTAYCTGNTKCMKHTFERYPGVSPIFDNILWDGLLSPAAPSNVTSPPPLPFFFSLTLSVRVPS